MKGGDIVVFVLPTDAETIFIKRVVGLPGEKAEVRGKSVLIDDVPPDAPWGSYSPSEKRGAEDYAPAVVPDGEYFLLGDNRDNSFDSRMWGTVKRSKILGRARYLYWSRKSSRIGKQLE